jgi:hypothetical protein
MLSGRVVLAASQVEGRAEVPFSTSVFSSTPDPSVRQKAVLDAQKNALDRYASGFSQSKFALFQKVSPQVYSQLNQYIIDTITLDEGANQNTKTYHVIIRASINDAKLDALLNQTGTAAANLNIGGKQITISYLFVAREISSMQSFDARRTQMTNKQGAVSATQSQGLNGRVAQYSESKDATEVQTTGGSTLQKADERTYRVTSPEDMNAAMNDIFASNNFEVYDYRDVVSQCGGIDPQKIYAEFARANELSRDTRNSAFAAARQCQIGVFAVGTLDVGMQDVDPVTGNMRVYVSARSQLLDVSGRLPRIIASVGPVQYAGLAPDAKIAEGNALKLAAADVAKSISDQLNSKGMH